jgi:hypothetical protein
MSHPGTDLITPEAAAEQGAHAPAVAVVLLLTKIGATPTTVHASNVRSARRDGEVVLCGGVVLREPVVFGEGMILTESAAPLLGFYNGGYDESHAPILCAAYGRPVLIKSMKVTVGQTFKPYVNSVPAIHYEGLNLSIVSESVPKTP